jgi:glycosyltransferase involved in cell wall biosynthesis
VNSEQETNGPVFVAWTKFMRRPESMRPVIGYELVFMPNSIEGPFFQLIGYVRNAVRTLGLLLRHRPREFWIQLAPVFLLYIGAGYKLVRPGTRLVADCHNSMFGKRWSWMPGAIALLNRCDVVLVHNKAVLARALERGVRPDRLQILETRPAQIRCAPETRGCPAGVVGDWVLMPASFSSDEPIDVVADAARKLPALTFVVTGDPERARGRFDLESFPPNVRLVGFLDRATLDSYFCGASVVLGLTTSPEIQLSVANEAAGAGKAMVLSDTPLLREMFPRGAIYVETLSSQSIADGLRQALSDRSHLQEESVALRDWRESRWFEQARGVMTRLGRRSRAASA